MSGSLVKLVRKMVSVRLVLCWLALITGSGLLSLAAQATPVITVSTSSIENDLELSVVNMTLAISGISIADNADGDFKKMLYKRLKITFPEYADYPATRVKFADEPNADTLIDAIPGFSITMTTDPVSTVAADKQSFNLKFDIKITDNNDPAVMPNFIKTKSGSGGSQIKYVKVTVNYDDAADGTPTPVTTDVELITAVADEQVANLQAESGYKSLEVSWTAKETLTFTDGVKRAPTGILVYVVSDPESVKSLPATLHQANKWDESVGTAECMLAVNSESSCSVTCAPSTYLARQPNDDLENVKVYFQSASLNSVNVPGLEPDQRYAIIAQYLPDGVGNPTCVMGVPKLNYSLSEINNPKVEVHQGDPACFVATAAYGTALDKRLDDLRWFRDEKLLNFRWGQIFVAKYYRYGPVLAALVSEHKTLKIIAKTILWVPVTIISLYRDPYPSYLYLLIFGMLGMTGVLFFIGKMHKSGKSP
jgi:hypothetical protein